MSAPRIVLLTPWERLWSMGTGGTPSDAYLLEGLLEAGIRVDLVAPASERADFPDHPLLRIRHMAPAGDADGRLASWWDLQRRLVRAGRSCGRADLVYGMSELATPAAALTARLWGVPSVGKLYGTFLLPALRNPLVLATSIEEVAAFRSPVTRLVVHDDGTGGDVVARALLVPRRRLRFWRNGVDHEACAAARAAADPRAEREALGLAPDAPLIYTASRLVRWKRVDRLLRALALLDLDGAVLAVAGEGHEREALEALAAELGVSGSVRFLGAVARARNLRLMAAADAFAATYDYSCVGNALLEAMTCGAPALVVDTGRTRDLVRDGENGRVLDPDDAPALAGAMRQLLTDRALRQRLSEGALRTARSEIPTREERARREVDLARELIGRGRR